MAETLRVGVLRSIPYYESGVGAYLPPGVDGDSLLSSYTDGTSGPGVPPGVDGTLYDMQRSITLTSNSATALGVGYGVQFLVSGLVATTWCLGLRIDLSWTNPVGTLHTKVIRRTRSWPFDLSDDYDVVYDGAPITSLEDSGATIFDPAKTLEAQTYYYYVVLASHVASPLYYDIADSSRIMGLSIAAMNSKDTFFWNNSPRYNKRRDVDGRDTGGGAGDLDKWFSVMGCWLNLMRGHNNALLLAADDDVSPYQLLKYKNLSLGTESEGESYDYSIARRQALSQHFVYARRGTCPGIVEAVRMFTLWNARCVETGLGSGCAEGVVGLRTWDGEAEVLDTNYLTAKYVQTLLDADGTCRITITGCPWHEESRMAGGKIIGPFGDIVCVESSTGDPLPDLELRAITPTPAPLTYTDLAIVAGAMTISVDSTAGIYPGLEVQISGESGGSYYAEIFEVTAVTPPNLVSVQAPLTNSYDAGAKLSIQKSIFRTEQIVRCSATNGSTTINVPGALWVENQYKGYSILGQDIASSGINTITLVGPYVGVTGVYDTPIRGPDYHIRVRVKLYTGAHSFVHEPRFDLEARGTLYDPSTRLWNGTTSLAGVWGPKDVGVYITTPGLLYTQGKPAGGSGNVLQLDPSSPVIADNQLVGLWLNPNQNQTQTFEIIANDATTITVDGDITSLINSTQFYWVMNMRDRNRFVRISKRLNQEFAHQDIRVNVLFI